MREQCSQNREHKCQMVLRFPSHKMASRFFALVDYKQCHLLDLDEENWVTKLEWVGAFRFDNIEEQLL